jgi:hypothetical protein
MFAALQILKAAYRNGYISADQQAAERVVDLMKTLEEYHFGGDGSEDSESDDNDTPKIST